MGATSNQQRPASGKSPPGPDYLKLTSHQDSEIADFSAPSDRHALAALALHGQPFGFTREDVLDIHDLADKLAAEYGGAVPDGSPEAMAIAAARAIADRIEALLPPEGK